MDDIMVTAFTKPAENSFPTVALKLNGIKM